MKDFEVLRKDILYDEAKEVSYDTCSKCCMMGIHAHICPICKKEFCKKCLESHECNKGNNDGSI